MLRFTKLGLLTLKGMLICLLVSSCAHNPPGIRHDLPEGPKPWSHLNFRNHPDAFQFAIVSDNAGGTRWGVFPAAVEKINLLQPEFVISVGDFIRGYTSEEAKLVKQWEGFDEGADKMEMPFFRVPGNHDTYYPAQVDVWKERHGPTHYWFVYKKALFLCLNSQTKAGIKKGKPVNKPGIDTTQLAWAKDALAKNVGVRWTFVFLHQPLWINEEGNFISARKNIGPAQETGFGELEKMLTDRPYTVFAGHYHEYGKFMRKGREYFILSTTGGTSKLRGIEYGEFDHITWVTMRPEGPEIANLLLDGIHDRDVNTETSMRFRSGFKADSVESFENGRRLRTIVPVQNPFKTRLKVRAKWVIPAGSPWTVSPIRSNVEIASHDTGFLAFEAKMTKADAPGLVPELNLRCAAGKEFKGTIIKTLGIQPYLKANRPSQDVKRAAKRPKIDGRLNDACWRKASTTRDFVRKDLAGTVTITTRAKLAWDKDNLYIAVRCAEPNMGGLVLKTKKRDGAAYMDDGIEFFLHVDRDTTFYHQFIVNAANQVFDAYKRTSRWDGEFYSATGREKDAFTVEMAIPWGTLDVDPPSPGFEVGCQIYRNRIQADHEVQAWAPNPGKWHAMDLWGTLRLGK